MTTTDPTTNQIDLPKAFAEPPALNNRQMNHDQKRKWKAKNQKKVRVGRGKLGRQMVPDLVHQMQTMNIQPHVHPRSKRVEA